MTSTFLGYTKIVFAKTHTGQKVRNIWQITILQIHWCVVQNGYHLTIMLQVKSYKFFWKNHFQICRKLGLSASNQRLDHRTKFFYLDTT